MATPVRFFPAVTPQELMRELPDSEVLEFEADTVLLKEGSVATSCYYVLKGRIQVVKKTKKQKAVPLATVHAGDFVGEMALLSGEKRSASAVSATRVKLLEVKREDLRHLFHKNSPFAGKLALHFASTVAARSSQLLKLFGRQAGIATGGKVSPAVDVRQVLHEVYSLWAV
jgi:CRP-like cAMP-binding protein